MWRGCWWCLHVFTEYTVMEYTYNEYIMNTQWIHNEYLWVSLNPNFRICFLGGGVVFSMFYTYSRYSTPGWAELQRKVLRLQAMPSQHLLHFLHCGLAPWNLEMSWRDSAGSSWWMIVNVCWFVLQIIIDLLAIPENEWFPSSQMVLVEFWWKCPGDC